MQICWNFVNMGLKEIADEVTDDIKDDGIYNSMKKYGLID